MPLFIARRRTKTAALAIVGLLLAILSRASADMIDLNHNGMSDIWELLYGSNLVPGADPDGDGFSNLQESIAATDPFDPSSFPRIGATALSGTNLTIDVPAALGKQYTLFGLGPVGGEAWTNWVVESSIVARSGSNVTFVTPAASTTKFFRVSVSDVDTSGSGINDWEKYQLGLDPFSRFSNGQIDSSGIPVTDYSFVTNKLAAQNVITISATGPVAVQPDPGQTSLNQGQFTVARGGFPLNAILVNLAPVAGGAGAARETVDYLQLPRSVYIPAGSSSATITLAPLANPNLTTPVVATLRALGGTGYKLGAATNASVVVYPSATPFGVGLTGQYFSGSSPTYTNAANFNPANLVMTRVDPTVDFTWGVATNPFVNNGRYSVRWTGQIEPQYSETYYFDVNSDDGVRLWVNDRLVIDDWVPQGATDSIGQIALEAGIRYDIRLEYFNNGGAAGVHMYWYSPSQPKQVIPASVFYPLGAPRGAAAVTSPLSAVAFLGQPFLFTVTGANGATRFAATGLPPGLELNPTNGLISGTPNLAGNYELALTASNSVGVGASVLNIQVLETGSSVTREVWLRAPGTNIADIPLTSPPSATNFLGTLEGITGFGPNYGERVRGYFTPPATGNYYFWIAGRDSAELWISDDSEPVNKVRRAYVRPGQATEPRQWTLQPNQRSGWLSLVAGQPYYLEILHKAGPGVRDNWSVGWTLDPTGTNTVPGGVLPGYPLSRYFQPPVSAIPGTLYAANLAAAEGVVGAPAGSATLRLSPDGSQATVKFNVGNLSSPIIGEHILSDPFLANPNQILFDISAETPQPDGSYIWPIGPVGTLQTAADVLEVLSENEVYLAILTADYPNGELTGHFTLANGTEVFTPPAAPPAWADDHTNPNAAARFLIQATFGPQAGDVAAVQSLGYSGWIENQMALPASHHLPLVLAGPSSDPTTPYPSRLTFNTWWRQSVTAPDQLRQRVAFALSEIMVVSENGVLQDHADGLSAYYDTLLDNAFGNYRQLLESVTLSPAMGLYLNMLGNAKGSLVTGIHANENYAREIMQLFSVGLYRLWPDGTLVVNSQGNLVPTYDQNVIMGMASEFTGWNYHQANQGNGLLPANFYPPPDYVHPMVLVPSYHDLGTKQLLDNVMGPQAWGGQAGPASSQFDAYCSKDLEAALDSIFNHQNIGPFICRELIQRLVTSNPSRGYLYRVVQVFNDDGTGVRGNLGAVVKAILLDYEARSGDMVSEPGYGKQREPLLRATALARALPAPPPAGGSYQQSGSPTLTITTANAHRLGTGDTVTLSFTDTSGAPAPGSRAYGVTVTSPTTFTVDSAGVLAATYREIGHTAVTNELTGQTIVTNAITVSLAGHGLAPGNPVYLDFTGGGASNGVYQVVWTNNINTAFTVLTADKLARSGGCFVPWLSPGGFTETGTAITVSINGAHGLQFGDPVLLRFPNGAAGSGRYTVVAVPDATHFTVVGLDSTDQVGTDVLVYPLVPPPFLRSGTVVMREGTWDMGYTDGSIGQSPLRSPTVFNFFLPGYHFPGELAAAGLTTPEFQLTSDTSVAMQMNFAADGLLGNGGNTSGLSSFDSGDGAVVLDLGPWMTPAHTSNAGIPGLVDSLAGLLTGGQLSAGAKAAIVNFAANGANFPLSGTPTSAQMRDRVRAVVHLIATSPEFIIQR
jgi:hypothetical protein